MTGDFIGEVLDELLRRLEGQPADRSVVLGATPDGRELRAGRHVDRVGSVDCPSVFVEVPDAPHGRLSVVLCRWSDDQQTLVYASPRDGAELPRWKLLELLPEGVRLSVRWPREEHPRVYEFRWLSALASPRAP